MHRFSFACLAALAAAGALTATGPAAAATLAGGVYPFAVGDVFTYQYDESETTASAAGTVTTPFAYVQTTTIEAPVTYDGVKAYPYVSTGGYKTSAGTTTVNDIEYRNFVTVAGKIYNSEYGYDDASTLVTPTKAVERDDQIRTYATPFFYDVLPEKAAASWAEPVAMAETSLSYDGTTEKMTRAADGAYTATGDDHTSGEVVPFTRVVAAAGNGTDSDTFKSGVRLLTFGLPVAKGAKDVLPVTEKFIGAPVTTDVPDWFPTHAAAWQPLAASAMTDMGSVKAPAACGIRAGTLSTELAYSYRQLDPVYGFTWAQNDEYYVKAGLGRICRLTHIVETFYDNRVTGAVTSTDTTTSSEVLLSEKIK